eukprot:5981664-Amphidinium_carterae.1
MCGCRTQAFRRLPADSIGPPVTARSEACLCAIPDMYGNRASSGQPGKAGGWFPSGSLRGIRRPRHPQALLAASTPQASQD